MWSTTMKNRNIILAGIAIEQRLKDGQQRHKEGDAFSLALCFERLAQGWGKYQRLTGPMVGLNGWTRPVGGELKDSLRVA